MKILQVNCVYNEGSTGKIVCDLHQFYKKNGISSIVCYGRGKAKSKELNIIKTGGEFYSKCNHILARITGIMYGGCFFSTRRLIKLIKREKPDIVHLHCINGYFVNIYSLLKWLKKQKVNTVLTLHAEFMYTGGCGFAVDCDRWKMTPGCGLCPIWKKETRSFFRDRTRDMWKKMNEVFVDFDNVMIVSVSPWLMKRAEQSSIMKKKKHSVIYNGVDISIFHKYEEKQHDKKVIFHASPLICDDPTHCKGGYYIIELARRMPNVAFVIAGKCRLKGEIPENVSLLGQVTNQRDLAKCYSNADLTVIASKRETFSMVCVESLCCGTPVVGFKAGAPEQIALKEYSEFVEYGNVDALENVVKKWLNKEKEGYIAEESKKWYAKEVMAQKYMQIYTDISANV